MSDTFTNDTGCEVTRSHITGDIVCQKPGPECDCLIVAVQVPEPLGMHDHIPGGATPEEWPV